MPIELETILAQAAADVPYRYVERDSMMYAAATGMARDPLDEAELDYVYARRGRLQAMPTQAVTVARHDLLYHIGLDVNRFLHGEQVLTLHRPLPTAGELLADQRVINVVDKGCDRGLLIETETWARLVDGTPVFDLYDLYWARGDGGIGGTGRPARSTHPMPDRPPDLVRTTATEPRQALLYHIAAGDRSAIHTEPAVARSIGLARPILHGSCAMAIACREILVAVCNHDASRVASFGTRFTSVVYPGEQLETQIWLDDDLVSFRCRVPQRDVTVLDNGRCRLRNQENRMTQTIGGPL